MWDILPDVARWLRNGKPIALATVIQTWGSAPRRVGAKMAFTPEGEISGSVSGGCVEAAVIESGMEVLKDRLPRLLTFGVTDETAWQVGLACGGQIEVFVQPLDPVLFAAASAEHDAGRPFAVATVVQGSVERLGRGLLVAEAGSQSGGQAELEAAALEITRLALLNECSHRTNLTLAGGEVVEVFIEVISPRTTLVIVGGGHVSVALAALARTVGYTAVVVDPRRVFSSPERFPHVDRLIQAWPEEAFRQVSLNHRTAVAVLTHDPKIDDPALMIALNSPAFYVGALGSRSTQAERRVRLLKAGLMPGQIDRLHAPIGLPIGGETPEEIALAVMAEVVATHRSTLPH